MLCPACKCETSSETGRCRLCHAPLPAEEIATYVMADPLAATIEARTTRQSARTPGFAELRAGALLSGRYEILSTLGEGGMGAVYKARDREVDRVVAVKVIRPELANQPEILSRFKQELILSRQVTHKNVVRIFDLGEAEGIKFITMEFVEGRDLRALLSDSAPVSLEQKVKIVIQVCRALDAAHAEGVVHRDLKPQNILVENTGRVVVMDFGIAGAEFYGPLKLGVSRAPVPIPEKSNLSQSSVRLAQLLVECEGLVGCISSLGKRFSRRQPDLAKGI